MASTYSDLKIELIGTGEQSGTWGTTTNTNLGTAIEEAITGSVDVAFSSSDVTLSLTDTNTTQAARNLRLNLTGTSGGARTLTVPAIEKQYIVKNGLADTVTIKNSTGTGVDIPSGKSMVVFNDATNVTEVVTHLGTITVGAVTLTTDLAVADGGTGASTASGARTNLGSGAVGDNVFTAATASAAQQAMDTEVGVDVQAYNAGLADISGLAKTDGNIIVGNGSNWVAESGSTARTSLGLGSIATQEASSVSITGGSITGITDLAVADGGTGSSSLTANNVLLGNGTSALQTVAPGTSGNVLTSNGTTWTSAAAATGITTTTGAAPYYGTRAWANFDGTLSGTITPRAAGNIASIVKNSTGSYTITFTTAMPDANYAIVGTCGENSAETVYLNSIFIAAGGPSASPVKTTTSFNIQTVFADGGSGFGSPQDYDEVGFIIIR